MEYQRKHPRFPLDTPAEVTILGSDQGSIAARVADVSEAGMRLMIPSEVAIGETLRVEIAGEVFVGVVRNSAEGVNDETLAGLELIHWIERSKLQDLLDEFAVEAF